MLDVNTGKLLQTENNKWQTRPLVREGVPQKQDSTFQTTFRQKVTSGDKSQSGLDTLTYWLADRQCNVTLTTYLPVNARKLCEKMLILFVSTQ
jgi:hypothetical protein